MRLEILSPSASPAAPHAAIAGKDNALAGSVPTEHSAPSSALSPSVSLMRGRVAAVAEAQGGPPVSVPSAMPSLSSSLSQASPDASEFGQVLSSVATA